LTGQSNKTLKHIFTDSGKISVIDNSALCNDNDRSLDNDDDQDLQDDGVRQQRGHSFELSNQFS
jgi:hypothetical protein